MKNYNLIAVICLILGLVCCIFVINQYNDKINELNNTNNILVASQDSIKKTFNEKAKSWEYQRLAYQAENKDLDDYLKEKEFELYKIKKERNALIGIISDIEVRIDTVVVNDTIPQIIKEVDSTIRIANISNEFYTANIKSYKDSTSLGLLVKAKQELTIDEKGSVVIVSHNPYVDVIQMNSFYVKQPKPKTKNWKYYVGFGLGIAGGIMLSK